VKGGTKWQRFKRNAKWLGVTVVTGVVFYKIGEASR